VDVDAANEPTISLQLVHADCSGVKLLSTESWKASTTRHAGEREGELSLSLTEGEETD